MFKWKVSGLGGGSSKKANKQADKLNNSNVENNNDEANKNNKSPESTQEHSLETNILDVFFQVCQS